ncbi:MAG: YeeE/YedE family protein [Bacteroidota bacterium]
MLDALSQPWPWYVAGPLIGLMAPLLLLVGGHAFGVSANLRHLCAATLPTRLPFLRYDWRGAGLWNLTFALGIVLGGAFAATVLTNPDPVNLAAATVADLRSLGIEDLSGLVPAELVSWQALGTVPGLLIIVGGGFLVGFGARYAGGCTSGHAILQVPSLVAVLGFFAGGLLLTYVLLPILL